MDYKKITTIAISSVLVTTMLASCGPNKKERALQELEQQQQQLNQQAKDKQLNANNLLADSENLDKKSKASSAKAKYEKEQAELLKAQAQQDLTKAASLDAQIEKAKSDATT